MVVVVALLHSAGTVIMLVLLQLAEHIVPLAVVSTPSSKFAGVPQESNLVEAMHSVLGQIARLSTRALLIDPIIQFLILALLHSAVAVHLRVLT